MMGKTKKVLGNDTKNMLNTLSGAYTIPLIDRLFGEGRKLSVMEDFYSALIALITAGMIKEAMYMIRGLFGIAGEEYPYFVAMLENHEEMQKFFVLEFAEDFYEVIEESKLEDT
ncbi:MAG: hypothetical protein K2J67_12380 [Lachnospiraceae bacterium]|nr:hypothetical protein [Lachnospiraceae bacterium]